MWLYRFAQLVVLATLCLIFIGGMVTSMGAGLAVPDWPLSYGSLNPPGWWNIENLRLEHGHRLFASIVGMLTIVLAVGVWRTDDRKWVRWLGIGALAGVCIQGLLGGLRVTQLSEVLAMVHACVAQAFLCVLVILAAVLSPRWRAGDWTCGSANLQTIRRLSWVLFALVYCQLIVGAIVRHLHAGLAIPDFPTAFGKLMPPIHSAAIDIHFTHRVGAVAISILFLVLIAKLFPVRREAARLLVPAAVLFLLIGFQIALGAHIIWLRRPPVTTTLHVVNGAAVLVTALLLAVRASRLQPAELLNGTHHPKAEHATV